MFVCIKTQFLIRVKDDAQYVNKILQKTKQNKKKRRIFFLMLTHILLHKKLWLNVLQGLSSFRL